jgi:hypothetical protein
MSTNAATNRYERGQGSSPPGGTAEGPLFDPLRQLPRFAEALRCAHLLGAADRSTGP